MSSEASTARCTASHAKHRTTFIYSDMLANVADSVAPPCLTRKVHGFLFNQHKKVLAFYHGITYNHT